MLTTCEEGLERHVDGLVAELSTELCHAAAADLDHVVETALGRIVETVGVDRTTLVQYDEGDRVPQTFCATAGAAGLGPHSVQGGATPWLLGDWTAKDDVLVYERVPEDLPAAARTPELLQQLRDAPVRSAVAINVAIGGHRTGALVIETMRDERHWSAALIERTRLLAEILTVALHRRRQEELAQRSRDEVVRLTARVEHDSPPAERREQAEPMFEHIIGASGSLKTSLARLKEVASTDSTVLLLGETGTGKELFARAIHENGPRRPKPLVIVNCAALPPTLIESELFGHARGAFTGATEARHGRFELAHHGTLFLDEIGDLPLDLQTKLLRVLQEGTFERLGSSQTQRVNVRIIAATHRDLRQAAAEGSFRSDLFYRLNVFPIRVPPLRERTGDIPALVWHIIQKRQRLMRRSIKRVPTDVMDALQRYHWPGNIRELENVIERALIHSTGETLQLLDEQFDAVADGTLKSVERAHISDVLCACGWRINGADNAAERLGMHPNTLRFRMKKLGIVRNRFANGATRPGD